MVTKQSQIKQRIRARKYAELEKFPKIECACGCGELITPFNKHLKPTTYARGHASRGKKKSKEEIEKRTATRLANTDGKYQLKGLWKHTPESIEKFTTAVRKRDLKGENNPFYGKHHTPESKAKMGAKGEKHPHWKGGRGTLPYGPEFTRKFKRMLRERDNYTCQSCGITHKELGRTLEIHHIDHNMMNNDPTNLVTVCGSCNVWYSWHRDEPFIVMGRKRSKRQARC